MPFEIYVPLTLSGLGVLAVALCLYLFVTVKAQMRALERCMRREREELEAQVRVALEAAGDGREALREIEQAVEELREANAARPPTAPPRPGINLNVRSQVLRRHRQGEQPVEIARSLGLPQTEVDLLLKVNRLMMETP